MRYTMINLFSNKEINTSCIYFLIKKKNSPSWWKNEEIHLGITAETSCFTIVINWIFVIIFSEKRYLDWNVLSG